MKSRLEAIDWNQLDLDGFPDIVLGLLSNDSDERLKAGSTLLDIFCQNDAVDGVYNCSRSILSNDAVLMATPFIVEIAMTENTKDKFKVIQILSVIAHYAKIDQLEKAQLKRAKLAQNQIASNFHFFEALLQESDKKLRLETLYLLHYLEPFSVRSNVAILEHIEKNVRNELDFEDEKISGAQIIFDSIKHLPDQDLQIRFRNILQKWLSDYFETISVQTTAAFFLIQLDGDLISSETKQIFLNVLKLPSFHHLNIPNLDECIYALLQLKLESATYDILEIFTYQTNRDHLHDLATILLSLHFGNGNYKSIYEIRNRVDFTLNHKTNRTLYPKPSYLNQFQVMVLSAFVDKSLIWEIETNIFGFFDLPNSREAIQELIDANHE